MDIATIVNTYSLYGNMDENLEELIGEWIFTVRITSNKMMS
jgi:hypothetical protein